MKKSSKKDSSERRSLIRKRWIVFLFAGLLIFNFAYQVYNKPAEALGVLAFWASPKTPYETWKSYGDDFDRYSTPLVTPAFLAALAQTESSGDPVATPGWRLRLTKHWQRIFAPASSSVGLFQFTKGTFGRASRYCVREGKVLNVKYGRGQKECWLNRWYTRLIPSQTIEVASAYLHKAIENITGPTAARSLAPKRRMQLAAITHLCGARKAKRFYRAGFRLKRGGRCGSHSLKGYLSRVRKYYRKFSKLSGQY